MSMLTFEQVSYYYKDGAGKLEILKNCSYSFLEGKFYTILGPSGSGKTTALTIASALDKPRAGKIIYKDKDIRKIGYTKYRKKNIAIVFQSYNLLTYMTALQNVTTAMEISGIKSNKNKALEVLSRLGITEIEAKRPVLKLSGGQQQRVAIARAIACEVDLIFADEPSGNLDVNTEQQIIDAFKDLTKEGKTVIVVTHSQKVANQSNIILELKDGKFAETSKKD